MRALVAALAVVAVVGIGPTPPALGQETLFRVDELAAFDGTGKRLGALAPIVNAFRPTRVTVLFRVGAARPAPVDFSRDGFFAEPEVAFTTRDCTGQAYLQADVVSDGLDGLLRRAMPVGPRGTFYVQSGPGQWQRIRSELNTFTGRCRGNDYDARVAPAEPRGPDLADYVMPPYSVRATVGPALSALTPDEPLAETDRLVVYDSAAKKLGTTAYDEPWTGHAVHVAFVTGSGGIVLVEVARSRLTSDVRPYFATTDCTGQAYVSAPAVELFEPTVVFGPRSTVYVRSGARAVMTLHSRLDSRDRCSQPNPPYGVLGYYAPLASMGVELADYFTPPFSVQAGRRLPRVPLPE